MSDEGIAATEASRKRRMPRWLLLGIGWLCVGLGFVGVFVPGMPATTFLLIAAWCFYRSSDRAHAWLLGHRLLGPYVRDFLSGKGMPFRSKVVALTMIWATCGSSAAFFIDPVWLKVFVVLCAVIGTVVILRVPTRRSDPAQEPDAESADHEAGSQPATEAESSRAG